MDIINLLKKHQSAILDKWYDLILSTYPEETVRFLLREKDPFANPVGSNSRKSIQDVYEALINDMNPESIKPLLDPVVRIRAVQEFTPAKALGFILGLKSVIRLILKNEIKKDTSIEPQLQRLDSRIDQLCLVAFDIYMGCREQIYQFKADHVKDRTLRLLKKANLLCEVPEVGTEIIPHNVYKNGGFGDT